MAEVMEQLEAARDELLDENDEVVGRVKDVKEVEKRLRHRLLPRNAWQLVPFFVLSMSTPQGRTAPMVCTLSEHVYTHLYLYILRHTCLY